MIIKETAGADTAAAATERKPAVRFGAMLSFFLPLGLSAALISISHVIINGTLARATINPEFVIAGYAIASGIFGLTEEAAVLMRQTCSALVRDRRTFRSMLILALLFIGCMLLISSVVAYTPAGTALFRGLFGAEGDLLDEIRRTYRVLVVVTLFSIIRCIYQGILISHFRTKWLTISMIVRLAVMYGFSLWWTMNPDRISGMTGALIFLSGMMVEAAVSYWEGRQFTRKLPDRTPEMRDVRGIFRFYRPMLIYAFLAVSITPSIQVLLGRTADMKLAVASYALGFSITWLSISFHTYMHQIVLHFYRLNPGLVVRFGLLLSPIPAVFLAMMAYTPVGTLVLDNLIGVHGELLAATRQALQLFVLYALVFPWVDFCNGLVMLRDQTRIMVWTESSNIALAVLTMIVGVWLVPEWNGRVGALALSLGMAAELAVLALFVRRLRGVSPVSL